MSRNSSFSDTHCRSGCNVYLGIRKRSLSRFNLFNRTFRTSFDTKAVSASGGEGKCGACLTTQRPLQFLKAFIWSISAKLKIDVMDKVGVVARKSFK